MEIFFLFDFNLTGRFPIEIKHNYIFFQNDLLEILINIDGFWEYFRPFNFI